MQIDECIKGRRSVRKYSEQEISNEVLAELVDLARFSPSWKNTQVVRYHVVKNQDIKGENCPELRPWLYLQRQDHCALQSSGRCLCGSWDQRL